MLENELTDEELDTISGGKCKFDDKSFNEVTHGACLSPNGPSVNQKVYFAKNKFEYRWGFGVVKKISYQKDLGGKKAYRIKKEYMTKTLSNYLKTNSANEVYVYDSDYTFYIF